MPNFKRFDRSTAPSTAEAFLAVQKNWKAVSINQAAFLLLGEPDAVEVVYDESEHILGLRRASPAEPYAFPIRKAPKARTYLISSQAFARHFGLQASSARRYRAELIEDEVEGDVLAVDLKTNGAEAAPGPPRGAQPSEGG